MIQLEDDDPAVPFQIVFTPDASSAVQIQSFALDEFSGGGSMIVDWEVQNSSSVVLSSGTWDDFRFLNDPFNLGGRTIISPDIKGTVGDALTLELTRVRGNVKFLAIDDITFAQIPEPSSVALALGAAALGLAASRQRRS